MGCACPTDSKPVSDTTGEDQIAVYESCLPFAKQPATKTATEVLVFSQANYLTSKQLKDLLRSLGMEIDCFEDENHPKTRLLQLFKEGKRYNARKIALMGVLLGSGTVVRKAEVLFNLYKSQEGQEMQGTQVMKLVQHACEVALFALPHYVQMELEVLEDAKALPKLAKYVHKLNESLPDTVNALGSVLLGTSQNLSEVLFKHKVATTEARFLCSSLELRTFAVSKKPLVRRPILHSEEDKEDTEELRREASDQVRELIPSPEGKKLVKIQYKLKRSVSSPLKKSDLEGSFKDSSA